MPDSFITMMKLLYKKSIIQVKVNGSLTEQFHASCGVKQGCLLSAALYVLAINPLLKLINNDSNIKGCCLSDGYRVTAMAYADDVTVIIRNRDELGRLYFHLKQYELVSGAKLNQEKTEGVWFGSSLQKPKINIQVNDEMKVLGI